GAWACSMPTLPVANASLGSTHRPVHEIGLIAPLLVAAASLVSPSSAVAVLKVAVLRSFDKRSTPFIIISGQYSQSKLSVSMPVFSPPLILSAAARISSKLAGGLSRPASLKRVLFQNSSVLET